MSDPRQPPVAAPSSRPRRSRRRLTLYGRWQLIQAEIRLLRRSRTARRRFLTRLKREVPFFFMALLAGLVALYVWEYLASLPPDDEDVVAPPAEVRTVV